MNYGDVNRMSSGDIEGYRTRTKANEQETLSGEMAEDDTFRSEYVRQLIALSQYEHEGMAGQKTAIPKVIFQFWDDRGDTPPDVQLCLDSWLTLQEKGFELRVFDRSKSRDSIAAILGTRYVNAFNECIHPAMQSDYFRLCHIYVSGGLYVDADELFRGTDIEHLFADSRVKFQPLCYNMVSSGMLDVREVLSSGEQGKTLIFYINNNPLIAPPEHPLIGLALERATTKLLQGGFGRDIQSTTGPGNLTASLVRYHIERERQLGPQDFTFIYEWDRYSTNVWPLSYRSDERNWRIWSSGNLETPL